MIRISVPYVYKHSEALNSVSSITDKMKLNDVRYQLYYAHSTLSAFLYQSVWGISFRVCHSPGNELLQVLSDLFSKDDPADYEVTFFDTYNLNEKLTAFKTVLEAEFQIASTYLVTPRRG
jgi:hypothetical protein